MSSEVLACNGSMASMQAQLALLIEMQVPNSRPPHTSDITSMRNREPSQVSTCLYVYLCVCQGSCVEAEGCHQERMFAASSWEKRYEGAMHRPLTLNTSLTTNSRRLSPTPPVSPPLEDAMGARVFAEGYPTPKLLSPQLPHHSEEGSWIYDGQYAPASFAMKRAHESQGALTMSNDATRSGSMHPITMIMRQADREANSTRTPARGGGITTKYSSRSPIGRSNTWSAGEASPSASAAILDPEHAQAVAKLNDVLFGPRSPPASPTRQNRAGDGCH